MSKICSEKLRKKPSTDKNYERIMRCRMEQDFSQLQSSLVTIASETFRVSKVFEQVLSKLETDDQQKYSSQFAWFFKRVTKALDQSDIKMISLEGKQYEAGDAITPLNIGDFSPDEVLIIQQMIEPIIISNGTILKTGTALLERSGEQ